MHSANDQRIKRARQEKPASPLPMRQGVSASRVWLPKDDAGAWQTVLDFLVERFPFIGKDILQQRMARGDIVDLSGKPFDINTSYQGETFLFYYREIPNEPCIPFKENILFKNDNVIVVDKPHFLPVTPTGRYVRETLLTRLKHHYHNEDISPIHRLDRETAGIILFTCNKAVRGAYQNLFQQRKVSKTYEAIAKKSDLNFPLTHKSRLEKDPETFFLMKQVAGKANSETHINLIESKGNLARYLLKPVSGKQHQLRVHMMSLGTPILNDPFYPKLLPDKGNDYSKPLQLLARSVHFIDPLSDEEWLFESRLSLAF